MELNKDLKKHKFYDGTANVKSFLEKVHLEASIKGYVDEKRAQFLASRLIGPAFDVYMRLPEDDKKDFDKIKDELSKEFERGQLDREEALSILGNRIQAPDESPHTFAYKLGELVKLAYPSFADNVRKEIAKDYYMRGVHPDMQIALKSKESFKTDDISALASETVRLALAGIKSYSKTTDASQTCSSVEATPQLLGSADMINSIADVVVAKLRELPLSGSSTEGQSSNNEVMDSNVVSVNNAGYRSRGRRVGGRRGQSYNRRGTGNGRGGGQVRKCRSCQSTEHLIKDCPTRFCQACGQRGHDQFDQRCQNYC